MNKVIISTSGRDDGGEGSKRRYAILQRNRELIEHYYAQSSKKDIAFLIFELSSDMTLPADVAAFVIKSVASSRIPTQVLPLGQARIAATVLYKL